ncbi:helix-turn-helix domain-containing protein [Candidatus Saccharibacteria bacterium]|nr:helix-turn-helix domain-containing protein [Candidatus Saccharibacteria bacterium]
MRKTNERTLRMMENYMELHEQGYSVAEIAKKFNLSETTVYAKLEEIAKKNGVTRESLKERHFEADHSGRNFTTVKPIDPSAFRTHYEAAINGVNALKEAVAQAIEDYDITDQLLQEDFEK